MDEKRTTYIHLISLFVVAIALRLLYLKLASDSLGFDHLSHYYPDSRVYLIIGDHILSWHEKGGFALLRYGPGYGLILAAIKLFFGSHLIWPLLFSVLMGGLAPVCVYVLAMQLFNSRAVALAAGGFSAVSLTSVALSCSILTDQPFFTLYAAALVCFVQGYKTGRIGWYALAGLLAGYGAYVRPMAQIWPVVFFFLVLVVPVTTIYRSRGDFIRRAGVTAALALLMVVGWSARNYVIHDRFIFGTVGIPTIRNCVLAQTAQKYWGEGKRVKEYRDAWEKEDGDLSDDQYPAAFDKAWARVVAEFKIRPTEMLGIYLHNMLRNSVHYNYAVGKQVPAMKGFMDVLNRIVWHGLGYLLIVLTAVGIVVMALRGQRFAAWLLAATYISFTAPVGASIWQGSRLHYPAEMAWSIVVAYLAVATYNRLRSIRSGRFTGASQRQDIDSA